MRAVAIDFGRKRIGIAVSDPTGMLARPADTVAGHVNPEIAARTILDAIARLEADDDPIDTIVVGWPKRLDGSANDQTPLAEALAAALERRSGRRVILQDERLTSHEAESRLAERERDWRVRKKQLDAAAAAVILQEYLDANRG